MNTKRYIGAAVFFLPFIVTLGLTIGWIEVLLGILAAAVIVLWGTLVIRLIQ